MKGRSRTDSTFVFFLRVEGSFRENRKKRGEGEGSRHDFFFLKRKGKLGICLFSPQKRSSFANSVSHRPRVKQKTGKEIIAPFPGKIYFRESAPDKVLDKVPLDGEQKSTDIARGIKEINCPSEMKLGHWYLFLTEV